MRGGKVISRPELLFNDDYTIVQQYQTEYRGLVQYYLLSPERRVALATPLGDADLAPQNACRETQGKPEADVPEISDPTTTPAARCGASRSRWNEKVVSLSWLGLGVSPATTKKATLIDRDPPHGYLRRNKLIKRLLAGACALCASTDDCEVHHIRKLADLKTKGRAEKPLWIRVMASRRRKTLIVCRRCHEDIHAGRPLRQRVSA